MLKNIPMSLDECIERYPRLIRAMCWAAILSPYEAGATLRNIRYVHMGKLPADYLRHGGGEAVSHFGGPQAVVAAAIRCRHVTRIDTKRLRTMAKACAHTWEPGASVRADLQVYDAEGQLIGFVLPEERIAWGHALREAGRQYVDYSYPSITEGITHRFG